MTFSRFDAADTRQIARRLVTQANEPQVSNRQFVVALVAVIAGLAAVAWIVL